MSKNEKHRQVVDNLFGLFELGEWDEAAKLFAKEAQIIGQYGEKIEPMTVDDFVQKAKHGTLAKLGKPVYLNRRVTLFGTNGFMEQHISQLTIAGQVYKIPVCLVGKFNHDAKITQLEEYLDPSPLMAAFRN